MNELEISRRGIKWMMALLVAAISTFTNGAAQSQEATARPTATEIMEKSNRAFYYQGNDMKVDVTMDLLTADRKKQSRVLTMLRRNESLGGNQKYFLYFHEPADVRRITFMVWKYPEKEDDRWIYVPAVDLVRRIAASDARSSFVGSDFTYEDISGRDVGLDTHQLLTEDKVGDRDCYVVESVPKESIGYVKRISWVDKTTFLPLKEEYYDLQKELVRMFSADKIEEVTIGEGDERKTVPTVTRRTMKNIKTGHRTEVTFTSVSYNIGLGDNIFTERYLRRPPKEAMR